MTVHPISKTLMSELGKRRFDRQPLTSSPEQAEQGRVSQRIAKEP
jgi:hypothetical protein